MTSRISRAALALALAGCGGNTVMHLGDTGNAGGSGGAGSGGQSQGGSSMNAAGASAMATDAGTSAACAINAGQSTPLAMTHLEYDNTVRDLLGDASKPSVAEMFPLDPLEAGFRREVAPVELHRMEHYWKAAVDLAQNAAARLAQILPCTPASVGESACATQFIATFGRRAFRRPLTPAEAIEMQDAYDQGKMGGDFTSGIRGVIVAMLSSPKFYEIEPKAAAPGLAPLGPYPLASRLSYFIYRSMPDDPLLDAAGGGKLVTKADVEREARRMLSDPKAHDGVIGFFSEWLGLDRLASAVKDAAVLPDFATVRADMVTETTKFVESTFFGDGLFQNLFMSSQTWLNGPLAEVYGQPGVVGDAFQQVQLDPKVRAGVLTQASFLSIAARPDAGSPTQRGLFVRDRVLCDLVPPPPPNLSPLPSIMPNQTNRERWQAAMVNPACAGCHRLLDPIGFGLEAFDAVGRYRMTDNGKTVDSSGEIVNAMGIEGPFVGAVELATKLSSSSVAQTCAAKQWFRFALSRAEADEDTCSLDAATDTLKTSGDLRELVVAIATTDSFRYVRW